MIFTIRDNFAGLEASFDVTMLVLRDGFSVGWCEQLILIAFC